MPDSPISVSRPCGKPRDVVLERGQPDRPTGEAVFSSKARRVERDVLPQRAREQEGVLGQIADEPAATGGREVGERRTVDEDRA